MLLKTLTSEVAFCDLSYGDAFAFKGKRYLKVLLNAAKSNAVLIDDWTIKEFTGGDRVTPVRAEMTIYEPAPLARA